MKLLITGAGGFLGQYVVKSALEKGHTVHAMVRPASTSTPKAWQNNPQIKIVRADLRSSRGISELLQDIDTVIHLAASKAGNLYEQFGGTVLTTENLLNAMSVAGVNKLVVISSFSVYEYLQQRAWSRHDENSPLAAEPLERDEYCQTKLVQEKLVLDQAKANNWQCVVLRPGVIFGCDNLWTARLGMQLTEKWWIRTGTFAALPLSYVENCADAVILAAEYKGEQQQVILDVVDGDTPSQREYLKVLQNKMSPRPHVIPIPWTVMRSLARLAWLVNRICFGGTAKIPGLFIPARLHARCKPLRYSNKKILSTLNWKPKYSWQEGVNRSRAKADSKR